MQNNEGPWVQYLVHSGSIIFILDSDSIIIDLVLAGLQSIRDLGIKGSL